MLAKHPIRVVARQTGLSPHLIRAWERRYKAVVPQRTESGQRLYSDADIERLKLLKSACRNGESISQVSGLAEKELREIVGSEVRLEVEGGLAYGEPASSGLKSPEDFLIAGLEAVVAMDSERLEQTLSRAAIDLSRPVLLDEVYEPLLYRIGESWKNGSLGVANEHMASAVARTFLGNLARYYKPADEAPVIIVATPEGYLHEFGALMVAVTASADGWNVIYLGPNSPLKEIAQAARQKKARAVALSLVYPAYDKRMESELRQLKENLGQNIEVVIGGQAAESYRDIIKEIGATRLNSLAEFRGFLKGFRNGRS